MTSVSTATGTAASAPPLVVIGASAGGVTALMQIAQHLPPGFPAPVCIVQHIGAHPSVLPDLLRSRGPNPAVHAQDGQRLEPGTLYVAPPDHHVLVDGDTLRLSHGPKENHARPAVDPLFRTAAASWPGCVIGVILTGHMDDGTVGLEAVKQCGGIAIVQDPTTAEAPSMPRSALRQVQVDHCVGVAELPGLLSRLAGSPAAAGRGKVPPWLAHEVMINRGSDSMEHLPSLGKPSPLTCPDCGGGLWELDSIGDTAPRYRCHTGHAFSPLALASAQTEVAEEKLWASMRALNEQQMLLRRMALTAETRGDAARAAEKRAQADRLEVRAQALRTFAERLTEDEG